MNNHLYLLCSLAIISQPLSASESASAASSSTASASASAAAPAKSNSSSNRKVTFHIVDQDQSSAPAPSAASAAPANADQKPAASPTKKVNLYSLPILRSLARRPLLNQSVEEFLKERNKEFGKQQSDTYNVMRTVFPSLFNYQVGQLARLEYMVRVGKQFDETLKNHPQTAGIDKDNLKIYCLHRALTDLEHTPGCCVM